MKHFPYETNSKSSSLVLFYEFSPPLVIKAKIHLFKVSVLCASPHYHAKLFRKYVLYLSLLTVRFFPLQRTPCTKRQH